VNGTLSLHDALPILKAAHAIRARYFLHLSNRQPELLNNAVQEAEASFTSVEDDLQLIYEEQNPNPWFGFVGNATNKIMRPSSYLDRKSTRLNSSHVK